MRRTPDRDNKPARRKLTRLALGAVGLAVLAVAPSASGIVATGVWIM